MSPWFDFFTASERAAYVARTLRVRGPLGFRRLNDAQWAIAGPAIRTLQLGRSEATPTVWRPWLPDNSLNYAGAEFTVGTREIM
jgi:hypothetical protein